MRNFLLVLTVVIIFFVSFLCGYYIYKEKVAENLPQQVTKQIAEATIVKSTNTFSPSLVTSTIEEKISPNATLVIKKYHNLCGHITKDYAEIPAEFVNMREEELKNNLTEWTIKGFSPDEIVIYKEVEDMCNEHYIVRENNGYVTIYILDSNNNETIIEQTEITTEYLTEQDKEKLKNGIKAIGKEELNSLLEDYE